MNVDKRAIGEKNTLELLNYINRFGWLTSFDLAKLIWGTAKQSLPLARRAIKGQIEAGHLIRRKLPDGGYCYVLSAAGARFLTKSLGVKASSGATLALGNHVHRTCSNGYLIHHILQGIKVYTEYEIQTGRSPVVSVGGKVPDGLIEFDEGVVWVEVENAWKNRKERERIVDFCSRHLPKETIMERLAPDIFLLRVAIVSTNTSALNNIVNSFVEASSSKLITDGQLSDIEIALLPIDKSLRYEAPTCGSLYWDRIQA